MDTEGITEVIMMKEVGVGLGTGNFQIILEGMKEAVVGLDQVQELVLIETELDVTSVGNMITSLRTIQLQKQKKIQSKYNRCTIWTKKTTLKLLVTDTYEGLNKINSVNETVADHLNV